MMDIEPLVYGLPLAVIIVWAVDKFAQRLPFSRLWLLCLALTVAPAVFTAWTAFHHQWGWSAWFAVLTVGGLAMSVYFRRRVL